jgi:hypothetical protein
MGRSSELAANLKAVKPGVKSTVPSTINIWARNDVLIVGNKNHNTLHPLIGDVLAFEVLQRLTEIGKSEDIHSCFILDFSGIYQKTLSKLKARMKLD